MYERSRRGNGLATVHAKSDLPLDDIKGFIPRVAVRRRATTCRTSLQEYFIATRLGTRSKHGYFFAYDTKWTRRMAREDSKRFGHGRLLFISF